MSYEKDILSIVKGKTNILLNKAIDRNKIIIIDFFNIYCSIIKFNKYKTFSMETYILCIKLILNRFKNFNIIIISKNIFEVEIEYIIKLTSKYRNILHYIIVEDIHEIKSVNRERDDYICFLFHLIFCKYNTIIVSNDKYRNFNNILNNIKPVKLHIYNNGLLSYKHIDHSLIEKYNIELKDRNILSVNYIFY